jgi:hypothetical protein
MLFIAQILPPKDDVLQQSMAAQLYQTKFIEFCKPVHTISIIPVYVKKQYNIMENNVSYFNLGKTNNTFIFNIVKLIRETFYSLKIISKKKNERIWFYNLNKSTFLIAFFAKYYLKNKIYIIVADHSPPKSFVDKIIDNVIKTFDGALVLNSNVTIVKNHIVMPGLLREEDIVVPSRSSHFVHKIFLSGSLGHTNGLDFALSFFSKHSEYQLYITGIIYKLTDDEFEALISQYKECENIHYLGRLDYTDYITTLKECDICLSFRNPNDIQHDYNFPSKILEYLSYNKFVISTKSYQDIHSDLLFVTAKTNQSFKDTINQIYQMSEDEIYSRKKIIYRHLQHNFSNTALNNNLLKLYR